MLEDSPLPIRPADIIPFSGLAIVPTVLPVVVTIFTTCLFFFLAP